LKINGSVKHSSQGYLRKSLKRSFANARYACARFTKNGVYLLKKRKTPPKISEKHYFSYKTVRKCVTNHKTNCSKIQNYKICGTKFLSIRFMSVP